MSTIRSANPIIGASSIEPFSLMTSTCWPCSRKYAEATFGYFVATRGLIVGFQSGMPITDIRHLAMPKSSSSYTSLFSSIRTSLPTIPISATPYSTYVGTSTGFAIINSMPTSGSSMISLRVSSKSLGMGRPASRNSFDACL
ncbi:hypothetical protein D3C78_1227630 [compost metagenome]